MPTILHRIILSWDLQGSSSSTYIDRYLQLHMHETNTLYMLLLIFIFKCILYFPAISHQNSLQLMEKFPLLWRDFGRDSEKLLQKRIVTYPLCAVFFFLCNYHSINIFFYSLNWSYQCCSVQASGLHYLPLLNWNERKPSGIFSLFQLLLGLSGFFSLVLLFFHLL